MSTILRGYSDKLSHFERAFALGFTPNPGGGGRFTGEPLGITFSKPISDMTVFLDRVFSGTVPFRLSGVPVKISDAMYRVTAVDLHVSQVLTFEVAPEFMRVYLPQGTCGNTLSRLYTNLQHYYDSLVTFSTGDGEQLF